MQSCRKRKPDENQVAALTCGAEFALVMFPLNDGGLLGRRRRAEKSPAQGQFLFARPVGQKSELPDAHKAAGEDM